MIMEFYRIHLGESPFEVVFFHAVWIFGSLFDNFESHLVSVYINYSNLGGPEKGRVRIVWKYNLFSRFGLHYIWW